MEGSENLLTDLPPLLPSCTLISSQYPNWPFNTNEVTLLFSSKPCSGFVFLRIFVFAVAFAALLTGEKLPLPGLASSYRRTQLVQLALYMQTNYLHLTLKTPGDNIPLP